MAVKRNSAEGQANGTDLTAANSGGGSGDAFDQIATTGSVTKVFSNAYAMHGSMSYALTSASSTVVALVGNGTGSQMTGSQQMYCYLTSYPASASHFMNASSSLGGISGLQVNSVGRLYVYDDVASVGNSAAGIVPLNTWFRLDMVTTVGGTTSTGRVQAAISVGDSTTPLYSFDSGTTVNTGTIAIESYRFGKLDSSITMPLFYADSMAWEDGGTSFIAPYGRGGGTVSWFVPSHMDFVDSLYMGASFSVVQSSTPTLGGTLVAADDSRFRYRSAGGWAFGSVFPDTLMYRPSSKYPDTYGNPATGSVEFGFTGQRFEVYFKHLSNTATVIRIKVNGQRLTNLPQLTGASSVGSRHHYKVDLGRSVTNALITLEFSDLPFGGIVPDTGATVTGSLGAYSNRVIFQGDSITDGSGENTGGAVGSFTLRLADYMGWDDPWNVAIGSTGYTVNGSSVMLTNSGRVDDITSHSPNIIWLWAGYNDGSTSITTAATSLITSYQTALPNVPIFVIGSWAPTYPAAQSRIDRDTELEAVAQTKGCYFISPLTGRVRNPAGTLLTTLTPLINSVGDVTAYVGADSVHPNDAGHNKIAKWFYGALVPHVFATSKPFAEKRNNMTGIASGTAITTSNSGGVSGSVFQATTGSVTVNTSADITGSYDRGMVASLSSSQDSYVSWSHPDYFSNGYIRCYVRRSATPGVTQRVARGYTGGTMQWELRWQADGEMVIADYVTGDWMSSVAGVTGLNTAYRVEAHITPTSCELRVYAGESNTPMTTTAWNGPTAGGWDSTRFGLMTTTNQTMSIDVAAVAISTTGWIGPA